MAFCTECGANIPEGIKFCTECGKPIDGAAHPAPVIAAAVTGGEAAQPKADPQPRELRPAAPVKQAQPIQAPPQPVHQSNADAPPPKSGKCAVMGMGAYMGTMLLFCIPVVGWLACIIMAFTAKNLNRRNFARANLVFLIIGIVLCLTLYFVFSWVMEAIMQYLNQATQSALGSHGGLGDLFNTINGTGLSGQ